MKKLTYSLLVLAAAAFAVGCKGKKEAAAPKGEVEVVVPCALTQ
jgi:hypothetical protein